MAWVGRYIWGRGDGKLPPPKTVTPASHWIPWSRPGPNFLVARFAILQDGN